jgi:hypothetical protein
MARRTAPPVAAPLFEDTETRTGAYSEPVTLRIPTPEPIEPVQVAPALGMSARAADLLARIAAHYGRTPEDQLLAMLTARAEALGLTGKGEVA